MATPKCKRTRKGAEREEKSRLTTSDPKRESQGNVLIGRLSWVLGLLPALVTGDWKARCVSSHGFDEHVAS